MDFLVESIWNVLLDSGLNGFTFQNGIMLLIGIILLYLAIGKGFGPLLLAPIAFGCLLANLPKSGILDMNEHGVMQLMLLGLRYEIFPPIIFLGVGAMTDFGPLISNPKTLFLGAAAQLGVFIALAGALIMSTLSFGVIPDFTLKEAAAIGIIGGADGPTALYLAAKMAPQLLPVIAVAAYSYMSLVPLIQPPVMKLLTTDEERVIVMDELREVRRLERLAFPVITTIVVGYCYRQSSHSWGY